MRLRTRMIFIALAAAAGALLVVLFAAGPRLRHQALDNARATLFSEARLMARLVRPALAAGLSSEELDRLVDAAAEDVRARVTIIAPGGKVLADAELSGSALANVENHANRPEIVEAREKGTGSSLRRSTTVNRELLYGAVTIEQDGKLLGFSRVAYNLSELERQASQLQGAVAFALLVAFGITAVLATLLVPPGMGSMKAIMEAAHRFAAGDLSARSDVQRSDELGELANILNATSDLLQERLHENERDQARTQAILSAMEDGVLAVDYRGIVLVANQTLVRGLDLQDPLGRHYPKVVHQQQVGTVIEEVLRTGERRAIEVEFDRASEVYAVTGVAFPGEAGAPHGAVLTFHDVTSRRRLEQIRRDFVANASHELRTPLTSIRGFVEALEDGALEQPETAERFLRKIRIHADRMTALLSDLLDLSRLESGQNPPVWEPVHPDEAAEDVISSFAALARSSRVELRHQDLGAPMVISDSDRVRRILEVLVDNAIKYTAVRHEDGDGRVEVITGPGEEGGARLEVADNGPGIEAEHLPRLFERFYRVDKARSRELGGTGLGLSIARHLAEGMQASLTVDSEPGHGTRFILDVPARPEDASETGGPRPS
jgi:two-component system phosphate regulon sensor histidine kinase PhoR